MLNRVAAKLVSRGVSANVVTWTGFGLGCIAALFITFHHFWLGLAFILVSRLCDGLDGCVARLDISHGGSTDLGGFLDIVLDFAFYGMIPMAFVLADPSSNAVAGAMLVLAFYVNGASFLTYALLTEKRGIDVDERGNKSLVYTAGLAEASETIGVFIMFCIFPQWFGPLAFMFSAVVLVTTMSRFALAYRSFK